MLPEISQDTSLRQPLPRVAQTQAEAAIKEMNFVSILAEMDLAALAAQCSEDGAQEANAPEKQAQELVESDGGGQDVKSIDDADITMGPASKDDPAAALLKPPESVGNPEKQSQPVAEVASVAGRSGDQPSQYVAGDSGKGTLSGDMNTPVEQSRNDAQFQGKEIGLSDVAPRGLVRSVEAAAGDEAGEALLEAPASQKRSREDAAQAYSRSDVASKPVWAGDLLKANVPLDQFGRHLPANGIGTHRVDALPNTGETAAKSMGDDSPEMRFALMHSAKAGGVVEARAAPTNDATDSQRFAAPAADTTTLPVSGAPVGLRASAREALPITAIKDLPDAQALSGDEGASKRFEEISPLSDRAMSVGREALLASRVSGASFNTDQPQALAVIKQVSEAIRLSPGGSIDIALSPEELGAVRMKLTGNEGQMTVIVQADRQETLDLMRRHIDSLSSEFRAIGYGDVSFSFQSGSSHTQGRSDGNEEIALVIEETEPVSTIEGKARLGLSTGLDIRI